MTDQQELNDEPQSLDDLLGEVQEEKAAAPVKMPDSEMEKNRHWTLYEDKIKQQSD